MSARTGRRALSATALTLVAAMSVAGCSREPLADRVTAAWEQDVARDSWTFADQHWHLVEVPGRRGWLELTRLEDAPMTLPAGVDFDASVLFAGTCAAVGELAGIRAAGGAGVVHEFTREEHRKYREDGTPIATRYLDEDPCGFTMAPSE